jgi:hypothetical protein
MTENRAETGVYGNSHRPQPGRGRLKVQPTRFRPSRITISGNTSFIEEGLGARQWEFPPTLKANESGVGRYIGERLRPSSAAIGDFARSQPSQQGER